MNSDVNKLKDLLEKIERIETGLSMKVDRIAASEQALSKWRKELTLEVEELKTLKNSLEQSLPELINKSMKSLIPIIVPQILPQLIDGFKEQAGAFVDLSLKEAQRLKVGIDQTISQVSVLISSHKKEMILRRFAIIGAFCLSCLFTGWGLFYFYPQSYHINDGINTDMAEAIVVGEVILENESILNNEQKEFLKKKAVERMRSKRKLH